MGDYPTSKQHSCAFCGRVVTIVRQGDGKPWRGRPNYWYAMPPHDCTQGVIASKANSALSKEVTNGRL